MATAVGALSIDLTTQQGQAWEAAFRRNQIFAQGLRETQAEMAETARQTELVANAVAVVMGDAITGSIRSWKDLGRVAIGVIQDILREQLRAAATAKASSGGFGGGFFGDLFGSLFGPSAGAGGGGGGFAAPAAPFGPGSVPFTAHGGRFMVGGSGGTDSKLAVLRVTPREDITVRTPAQQRAGRGGGFTFNDNRVITIDARGADAGVDRKIRDAMERTQAATVAKVRDLVERGGRYSAVFGV